MKPIRFSAHAREQAKHRGATEDDVEAAIREGRWRPADRGRYETTTTFPFNAELHGKRYGVRRVRVIFAEKADAIVVVTVYVYYADEEEET